MPFGYMAEKLEADGAVNSVMRVVPNVPSGLTVWINCPSRAGSDKKAVAKITGTTPAAISLSGKIDLIPP